MLVRSGKDASGCDKDDHLHISVGFIYIWVGHYRLI